MPASSSAEPASNATRGKAAPRATAIRAPHGASVFEIEWNSEEIHRIPHEILRGFCPCASCQGHSGSITFQAGKNLELRDIKPVGNYALSLKWGDSHDTGIYSFEYLHRLGELHATHGTAAMIELETLPRAVVVPASKP